MMGALLLALLMAHWRRVLDVAIAGGFIVVTALLLAYLPLAAACSLWALLVVIAVVALQHRTAGGTDPQLEAEEAERRAAIMRGEL